MMAAAHPIAAATSSGPRHSPVALFLLPGAAGHSLFQIVAAALTPLRRRLADAERPVGAAAGRACSPPARHTPQTCARRLGRNGLGVSSRSGRFLFPRSCGPP